MVVTIISKGFKVYYTVPFYKECYKGVKWALDNTPRLRYKDTMITKPAKIATKKKKEVLREKVKAKGKIGSVEQGLKKVEELGKQPLTIPIVAAYLKRGCSQSEIGRIFEVSPQAVNQYIERHSEQLAPLVDKDDSMIAMKAKHLHDRAMNKLLEHVEHATQKEMVALNMISGTHFDKYRLGTNQSTQNSSSWMHIINDTPV